MHRTIPFLLLLLLPCLAWGQTYNGDPAEIEAILKSATQFSQAYMDGNYAAMAEAYTEDGKIFPGGADIIEGHADIEARWALPEGYKILHHRIMPEEITITGDSAYDYGYYEGKTQRPDESVSEWKGKYVAIWKKTDGAWKMYIDIWNRVDTE